MFLAYILIIITVSEKTVTSKWSAFKVLQFCSLVRNHLMTSYGSYCP